MIRDQDCHKNVYHLMMCSTTEEDDEILTKQNNEIEMVKL